MNIYVHTPREWYELYELGRRQFGCFIGHTGHEIIEQRFDDGDYSHFIEQPNVLRTFSDIHTDIKDHWIHESLENEPGWFRYNKLSPLGRSPDFFVTDLEPEAALSIIEKTVHRINTFFHDYEQQHNESPAKVRKFQKKRLQDYHRIPSGKLLDYLYETVWQHYNRDAKIAVIRDAHGRISEYLLDKGFTNITTDEDIKSMSVDKLSQLNIVSALTGHFDYMIGNPPYNNGMYVDFLQEIGVNGQHFQCDQFDVLLPSYTFTRKKGAKVCRNDIHIESIDMTVGTHFPSISGTWVTRFTGRMGATGNQPIELTLPSGEVTTITLDDMTPTSEKFIKPHGLTIDDLSIVKKVLNGTVRCQPHKDSPIDVGSFAYIKPTLKYVGAPSAAAGSFTLNGGVGTNGWMIDCDDPDRVLSIYTESRLFVYIHWLMISDFPMVSRSYIESLPDVTQCTYKNEADLYAQFNLTESEINRIESIFL